MDRVVQVDDNGVDLIELGDVPPFEEQVKLLLAEVKDETHERLRKIKTQSKRQINAWVPSATPQRRRPFSNIASSIFSNYESAENRRFWKSYGYNFGERTFIASSHYSLVLGDQGRRLGDKERPIADYFADMDAFRRAASNPKNLAPVDETDWAVGFYHDPEASRVTMISSGKAGLWLVLMEEDGARLRPRYITQSNARHIIRLRKVPDGAHCPRYYVLVIGADCLERIAEFTPGIPLTLKDMNAVIEQGIEILQRQRSLSTLLLLISLQEVPLDGSAPSLGGAGLAEASLDPRKQPKDLNTANSKAWFTFHKKDPSEFHNQASNACFPNYISMAKSLGSKSGMFSTSACGFVMQPSTIAFSTSLRWFGDDHPDSKDRTPLKLEFDSMEAFKASLKLSGDELAIGVQVAADSSALAVARFGETPLAVVLFEETSEGAMRPLDKDCRPGEIVTVPLDKPPRASKTREYWVAFVSPAMVAVLRGLSDLKAGEKDFYKGGQEMWKAVSRRLFLFEKGCNECQFHVFRLKPLATTPKKAIPTIRLPSLLDLADAAVIAEAVAAASREEIAGPPPQTSIQKIFDMRAQSYYIGHELGARRSPSGPPVLAKSFGRGGVYLSGSILSASRYYGSSRKDGQGNLSKLIRSRPQPSTIENGNTKRRGISFLVGLDRDAGRVHMSKSRQAPLTLISLQTSCTGGGLSYREINPGRLLSLTVPIEAGVPTAYAVVNGQILAMLPELLASLSMPRTTAELESLALILDGAHRKALEGGRASELEDWLPRVVLFTANIPFNEVIEEDEPTSSDSEERV